MSSFGRKKWANEVTSCVWAVDVDVVAWGHGVVAVICCLQLSVYIALCNSWLGQFAAIFSLFTLSSYIAIHYISMDACFLRCQPFNSEWQRKKTKRL